MDYKCPQCGSVLQLVDRVFRCENNHSFDQAKEGYVNLHLVQHKKSKQPGDNDLMIKGRKNFLDGGYYQFLADFIAHEINACLSVDGMSGAADVLDIGCGEGYYLAQLKSLMPNVSLCGIDISKVGIKYSSKRKTGAQLAVASAFDLPFFDQRFDAAFSIFSPYCVNDTVRILKPGGYFIVVGPGQKHLQSLARCIYDKPIPHQGNFEPFEKAPGLDLQSENSLSQKIDVQAEDLLDLLMMTPYYWRATEQAKTRLQQQGALPTMADFVIRVYRTINSA